MSDINLALETADKIRIVADSAGEAFIERSEAIRGLSLGLACGEHVTFLAPPGTAKTKMGDYFAKAFACPYFYTALGIESTADELFGPTDPTTLNNAVWSRKIAGLATCVIGFVDEVGKGSQEVQNLILGVMEERQLPMGDQRLPVPLHMLFSATNETLDQNPAFWDRWTIRVKLGYIREGSNFRKMLTSQVDSPPSYPITPQEFANLRAVTRLMALSPSEEALQTMYELWHTYPTKIKDIPITDRRWRRVLLVGAGAALLRGSDTITPIDLSCASFMLWSEADNPGHIADIKKWVSDLTDKEINFFNDQTNLLAELEKSYKDLPPGSDTEAKSKLYYRVERLLVNTKKQRGVQWKDFAERCDILKGQLMAAEINF